jgi:hypothetical protein
VPFLTSQKSRKKSTKIILRTFDDTPTFNKKASGADPETG